MTDTPEPASSSCDDQTRSLREWTDLAAKGDERAFERIHQRFGGGLLRFFLKRSGNRTDLAEELAQMTWVELWRALRRNRYDPERGAISTFTYAIAFKIWLQHLRRSRGDALPPHVAEHYLSTLIGHATDADGCLSAAELLDALRACLSTSDPRCGLSDIERRIVISAAGGRSERALATELGVAASTINARKKRAYEKLRKCLAAKGFRSSDTER